MVHTQAEVEDLRECVKEIIDENFFSTVHELKKKLVASNAKQQELESRLAQYKEAIAKFKECHQCHTLLVEYRDAFTQTTEVKPDEETDQELPRKGCLDSGKDLNENTNTLKRSELGDTTTTSETPRASTSFQQESAAQPKMEIQEPNIVAGPSRSNGNLVQSSDVEIICISDDE